MGPGALALAAPTCLAGAAGCRPVPLPLRLPLPRCRA